MTEAPVVRLHLFFATGNDRAVILRQGPTRQFRLILWHRDTDSFEDGQWLKQKVYVDRCDLSPDGRHFLYFALNGDWSGESEGAYTAISRPPYFTALALFPEGSTWGGGGRFLDARRYVASGGADIIEAAPDLERLRVKGEEQGVPFGVYDAKGRMTGHDPLAAFPSASNEPPSRTHARDLYDTQGGILYRRRGHDLEPIRDFTKMSFEEVRAPYEAEPSSPRPWHPLDGEGTR